MYDRMKLLEARDLVKAFNVTTNRKIEHTSKVFELQELYDSIRHNNTFIFDYDNEYYFRTYKTAVFSRLHTKKDLDRMLKSCLKFLFRELKEMYNITYTCEWNADKQTYVEV